MLKKTLTLFFHTFMEKHTKLLTRFCFSSEFLPGSTRPLTVTSAGWAGSWQPREELSVILPHRVSSISLLEVRWRGRREGGKWWELCQHTCTSFGLSWTLCVLMMYNLHSLATRSLKTLPDRLNMPLIPNFLKQVRNCSPLPTPCCR